MLSFKNVIIAIVILLYDWNVKIYCLGALIGRCFYSFFGYLIEKC